MLMQWPILNQKLAKKNITNFRLFCVLEYWEIFQIGQAKGAVEIWNIIKCVKKKPESDNNILSIWFYTQNGPLFWLKIGHRIMN